MGHYENNRNNENNGKKVFKNILIGSVVTIALFFSGLIYKTGMIKQIINSDSNKVYQLESRMVCAEKDIIEIRTEVRTELKNITKSLDKIERKLR